MKKIRIFKMITTVLFMISLFCTIDLGLNLLYNTQPLLHDGLANRSILHAVFGIFGDSLWSFDRFFEAFKISAWITFALLGVNIIISFFKEKE